MSFPRRYKAAFKVWLEYEGKPFLGRGGAEILKCVEEYGSLSEAARRLDMSYRYTWGYVKSIEKVLGGKVLETFKGGKTGGGGARLTQLGRDVLNKYERTSHRFGQAAGYTRSGEAGGLKASARNRFRGKAVSVEKSRSHC